MQLTLYHFPRSSCSRKVLFALRSKGLQYDEVIVDLPGGEHKRPEFMALNPRGEVPVLQVDQLYLRDSAVINEFLEELCPAPALLPSGAAERALCRLYAQMGDRDFYPLVSRVLREHRRPPEARNLASIQESIDCIQREILPFLEGTLSDDRTYLCGESITLADIAFAPALGNLVRVSGFSLQRYSRTAAWLSRIESNAAYGEVAPQRQLEVRS